MSRPVSSAVRVFSLPVLLGLTTTIGLLAALLFGPEGRYVAWVMLALPVVTVLAAFWQQRSKKGKAG